MIKRICSAGVHAGQALFQLGLCSPRRTLTNRKYCLAFLMIGVVLTTAVTAGDTNVQTTLEQLLADEDTDNDKKITIDDPHITGTQRGDKRFWMELSNGQKYEISGTYYLSNLLQELSLASEAGKKTTEIPAERIFELPVDRITSNVQTVCVV